MTAKGKDKPDQSAKGNLRVVGDEADRDMILAQTALRPTAQAGATLQQWSKDFGKLGFAELVTELSALSKTASSGDLGRAEAMLVTQAHTLDAIFNELARRAHPNITGGYLGAGETYLRLALKAQSQCRTTLEALAEIKNPRPVAFVKQQNIAAGPQQVNNGSTAGDRNYETSTHAGARAEEKTENPQTKLLEKKPNERLDTRAPAASLAGHPTVETVAQVDRTENGKGQGRRGP